MTDVEVKKLENHHVTSSCGGESWCVDQSRSHVTVADGVKDVMVALSHWSDRWNRKMPLLLRDCHSTLSPREKHFFSELTTWLFKAVTLQFFFSLRLVNLRPRSDVETHHAPRPTSEKLSKPLRSIWTTTLLSSSISISGPTLGHKVRTVQRGGGTRSSESYFLSTLTNITLTMSLLNDCLESVQTTPNLSSHSPFFKARGY